MAAGLARGRRERRHPTQPSEGGLIAQLLRIVPGGQQQRRRDVGANPLEGQQLRSGRGDQPVQVPVQLSDLGRQLLVADGNRPQGQLGRCGRGLGLLPWTQPGCSSDQSSQHQSAQLVAQLVRGGDDQGMQLVGSLGSGLDR
jgi:hypothetical protein